MKRTLCVLLVAFLFFSAPAYATVYTAGESSIFLVVGTDIEPGRYMLRLADGEMSAAIAVIENSSVQEIVSVDSLLDKEKLFTVSAGQEVLIVDGSVDISPVDSEAYADYIANDPYYTAIKGVNLHEAFKDAETEAESSKAYPLLVSVGYGYDERLKTFTVSVRTLDDITPEIAKQYCADFIRLLNDACSKQSSLITKSNASSYGGVFDKFDCTVTVFRDSDMPDFSNPIIMYAIPAGSHGKYVVDMSGM